MYRTYTNLDGILNKRDELNMIITNTKPDLVTLTETKLNKVSNSEVFGSDYNIYRKGRVNQVAQEEEWL